MKRKIAAMIAALIVVCAAGSAFAFNWSGEAVTECEDYTIVIDKYIKVESDMGTAFTEAAHATAKKGDTVYWLVSVTDVNGEEVKDYEIKYHGITYEGENSHGLSKGKATSAAPWIEVNKTEKTSIDELYYNGKQINISADAVTIGELTFIRNSAGIVTDVTHSGNAAELIKELAAFGMTVDDVYSGKVCMTDNILIANFGKVCKVSKTAYWGEAAKLEMGALPKTGDAGTLIAGSVTIIGAAALVRYAKRKGR